MAAAVTGFFPAVSCRLPLFRHCETLQFETPLVTSVLLFGIAWRHAPLPSPPDRLSHRRDRGTLYLLGEQDRIVGVSGYAVRPPQVRREKPRVSAFISADLPKILALEPDLVLAFSDLQADIVAELVRAGVAVHVFNQRDIAGIFAMIRALGAMVGAA